MDGVFRRRCIGGSWMDFFLYAKKMGMAKNEIGEGERVCG
jgi:hypothetical protein